MKITETEFYNDLLGWLAKAKYEQIIVINEDGATTVVVGVGNQILPDPDPIEYDLLPPWDIPYSKPDYDNNPWLN